ncbi:hypothetical protein M0805_002723, partial [Coniferiporia weirii]
AGHLLALDALAPGSSFSSWNPSEGYFKAYNLGKGNGLSVLDILEAMRKATGFNYKYEIIGRRKGDVPYLIADPALAEKELGFKAPQGLDTMCNDLWNWQTRNPQGFDGPFISGDLPAPAARPQEPEPVTSNVNGQVSAASV